ncbi:MAG: N-acetylmuramoyl-L-alanine amidase [Ruminococcaceae bacterium]|nr:N-acetylmuramoyl-L-alanine amidase [Oscillospiraceae bacterium]
MSNSALATLKVPAHHGNYTQGRSSKITEITLHHVAAVVSAQRCGEEFQRAGREGSAHYGIGNDGEIALYVNECDTAWANSNWEANCRSVSIETSNSATGGDWPVSDAALKSLIRLCADIAKRNKLGKLVKGKNLCWHSMYAATTCPGNYLRSKIDYIAREANKLNGYYDGTLAGNDIPRAADDLVLYIKGLARNGRTGTNMWGYELAIDKNGVALEDPHYSGNTKIPEGGKVLSGHGKAGEWIKANIKKGYHVWFDTSAHVTKGIFRSVSHFNGIRGADELVIYNKGEKSNTNMWGWEVAVNAKGHVTKKRYGGKTPLLEGGFVLSGHGESASWINKNIKVGDTVKIIGGIVRVT